MTSAIAPVTLHEASKPKSPRDGSVTRAFDTRSPRAPPARPELLLLLDLEENEALEVRDHVGLLLTREAGEGRPGSRRLAAVLEDRLRERGGAAVVQVRRGRSHAPEILGQEDRGAGPDLVDRLGQARAHVVALEIAPELDQRLPVAADLQRAQPIAHRPVGVEQHVVGLVPGEIELDRARRVDAERERILAGREARVAIRSVLTRLAEDRIVERERRHVTGGAAQAHALDQGRPPLDAALLVARERRLEQPELVELEQGGGPGLRREIDRECGLISDRHLVLDAVVVAVHSFADDLDGLHAHLVVRGVPVEVAQRRPGAFPLEGLDHEIGIDSLNARRAHVRLAVAGPAELARDPDRAEADPLRLELRRLGLAAPAGRLDRPGADPVQVRRHLLGQALHRAGREHVRCVALDDLPRLPAAARIAMDVAGDVPGAVVEGLVVAGVAVLGVRAREARRLVVEPLGAPAQVGARHAREALAVADVGSHAVDRGEDVLEQLVAYLEGHLEGKVWIRVDQRREHLLFDARRFRRVQGANAVVVEHDRGRAARAADEHRRRETERIQRGTDSSRELEEGHERSPHSPLAPLLSAGAPPICDEAHEALRRPDPAGKAMRR
jgi:hypothetical protein